MVHIHYESGPNHSPSSPSTYYAFLFRVHSDHSLTFLAYLYEMRMFQKWRPTHNFVCINNEEELTTKWKTLRSASFGQWLSWANCGSRWAYLTAVNQYRRGLRNWVRLLIRRWILCPDGSHRRRHLQQPTSPDTIDVIASRALLARKRVRINKGRLSWFIFNIEIGTLDDCDTETWPVMRHSYVYCLMEFLIRFLLISLFNGLIFSLLIVNYLIDLCNKQNFDRLVNRCSLHILYSIVDTYFISPEMCHVDR